MNSYSLKSKLTKTGELKICIRNTTCPEYKQDLYISSNEVLPTHLSTNVYYKIATIGTKIEKENHISTKYKPIITEKIKHITKIIEENNITITSTTNTITFVSSPILTSKKRDSCKSTFFTKLFNCLKFL